MSRHLLCIFPWMAMGGAERFNLDMLAGLRARGWRATVVTTLANAHAWRPLFAQLADELVDLTAWPPDEIPARLAALAPARDPDCVLVSHSRLGYELLPYLRAHLSRAAFVDYCHATGHDGDPGHPASSLARAGQLDLQIVASAALRRWMVERGGDPGRIRVCTVNVDTRRWDRARFDRAAIRAGLDLTPESPVVLYAGRMEYVKQPWLALDIMRAVADELPGVTFLVAGDGVFGEYLRRSVRRCRLERQIRLLGAVPPERVAELLAASDVLLLPSRSEGISMACYEALAMQVVPVSADVGGQAELITPEVGVLVRRGPGERARYVAALLGLLRDPVRRAAMGAAGRRRVEAHFALAAMGERMAALLEEGIRLHQDAPRPPVTPGAALRSAQSARALAAHDAEAAARTGGLSRSPRRHLWQLYGRLVDQGAWWLVPVVERAYRVLRAR